MSFLKNIAADPPPQPKKRNIVDGGFLFLLAVTLSSCLGVLYKHGLSKIFDIILETIGFLAKLSPKIAMGTFIASTLPLLLPRDKVAGWIGRDSGIRGILLAILAGAAIPGGPMMIFPIAAGFVAAGADIGAIIAFVASWNLLGLNRTLIWEFSFFGPHLVWVRWCLSLPIPLLLGMAARSIAYRYTR